jgi:hypothetical protein
MATVYRVLSQYIVCLALLAISQTNDENPTYSYLLQDTCPSHLLAEGCARLFAFNLSFLMQDCLTEPDYLILFKTKGL